MVDGDEKEEITNPVGIITDSHSSENIMKHDFVVRKFFPMLIWTKCWGIRVVLCLEIKNTKVIVVILVDMHFVRYFL